MTRSTSIRNPREGKVLAWLVWTLLVFGGGYVAALRGPEPQALLERLGVHVSFPSAQGAHQHEHPGLYDHHPEPDQASEGHDGRLAAGEPSEAHELLVRVGEFVGALRGRMDELTNNRRENGIARNILRSRGEEAEPGAIEELEREDARFEDRLADLQGALDEALLLQRRLQEVVDIQSGLAQGPVDGRGTLTEAEGLLARMRLLGVDPLR